MEGRDGVVDIDRGSNVVVDAVVEVIVDVVEVAVALGRGKRVFICWRS